ncbi:hypothetical protein WSM22_37490 [Cytophagales bacterium WSM2-2]|nr:hypothetical protein WSM22_37490 [Cytophagales bacterium WSM2-2]
MKVMHWSGDEVFLLTGFTGMTAVYSMHFIRKPDKKRLDKLKAAWVVLSGVSSAFIIEHLPGREELTIIEDIMLLILFIDFGQARLKIISEPYGKERA